MRNNKLSVTFYCNAPFVVIGEKITPTGRKKMAATFKDGNWNLFPRC